jgi:lysozyme
MFGCNVAQEQVGTDALNLACGGEFQDALRVCGSGPTVTGIDVSFWQASVNWTAVKAQGHSFAFARISDGVAHSDTQFAANWQGMKAAGLTRGAYQFFRSNQDPVAQADLVVAKLQAAGGIEAGDLPVVLDLESTDGQTNATVVAKAKQWLARVEELTGKRPLVYTAAFMSPTLGNNFGSYPLWVANYGATCPSMPSGFTQWKFWQYTDSGHTSGVNGNTDTNVFNGDEAALAAFVASSNVGATQPGGGTVTPGTGTPGNPPPAYCTVATATGLNGGRLNIRPDPSTAHGAVATLTEGHQVPILSRADGQQIGSTRRWLKIRNPAGVVGWVSGRYMKCVGAGALDTSAADGDADLGYLEGHSMGEGDGLAGPSSEVVAAPCGGF